MRQHYYYYYYYHHHHHPHLTESKVVQIKLTVAVIQYNSLILTGANKVFDAE
jgi:hypothetical protein